MGLCLQIASVRYKRVEDKLDINFIFHTFIFVLLLVRFLYFVLFLLICKNDTFLHFQDEISLEA